MSLILGNAFKKIALTNDNKTRFAILKDWENVEKLVYDYLPEPVDELQKLNVLYNPQNSNEKAPVIIDVHGGGWYYGDKDLNSDFNNWFVTKGYTVISVGYRLIDLNTTFKEQLQDVFAALNWVVENADKHNLDMDNVFIMRDSAGAHLAGLVLNCMKNPEMANDFGVTVPDIKFNAVNFTCGAFTPSLMAKVPILRSFCKPILGKEFKKSPLYKYFDITANLPNEYPPIHMVTCDGDFLKKMVFKTKEVFDEKGFYTELLYIDKKRAGKNLKHVFNLIDLEDEMSLVANNAIDKFFKKHIS